MGQAGSQRDPSDVTPCQEAGLRKSHTRTSRSAPAAPRIRLDADAPNIFQSASANTVVQAKPSLVYMDKENTAPIMPSLHDADNCLTHSRCSSVVSPQKVTGEEAARAAESATLSASLARKRCAGLAEYLEERRAEAENSRLASMHAREEFRRAQMAQPAHRDDRRPRPLVLVEQVHWSANVQEERHVLSSPSQSLAEMDLSRKSDPLKPDMGEAASNASTTDGGNSPDDPVAAEREAESNASTTDRRTSPDDPVAAERETESNASTTDRGNSPDYPVAAEREELCFGVDQLVDADISVTSPGSPRILDMDLHCGPLLVDLDEPPIQGERLLLRSLSAESFGKRRQSRCGLTNL